MATKTRTAKAASKGTGSEQPKGLQKPVQPSKELAAVVGAKPLPRSEVVRKVWAYIKQHKLQNPENGREILADDKLQAVFGKPQMKLPCRGTSTEWPQAGCASSCEERSHWCARRRSAAFLTARKAWSRPD